MKLLVTLMSLSDGAARSLVKSAVVKGAKAKLMAAVSKSKAVLMSVAFGLSLSVPAFATEDADLTKLVDSTDTVAAMVTKTWGVIVANPLLLTYAGTSFLTIGIGVFMYLKKAARH